MSPQTKPRSPRRVLGIDPGYGRLGWAILEVSGPSLRRIDSGCIVTEAALGMPERLQKIYRELDRLCEAHQPNELSLERLFFSRNTTTALGVAEARGIVLLIAGQRHISCREFTPNDVKVATTGYGRADKAQMTTMVRALLKMTNAIQFDDEADALAIAICAANNTNIHAT